MVDVQKTSGGQPTQMDLTNSSAPQGTNNAPVGNSSAGANSAQGSSAQGSSASQAQQFTAQIGGSTTDEQSSKPDSAAVDAAKAAP